MYVDPMCIYREYVQNAADAIDEARASGVLDSRSAGLVDVRIDARARSIKIRDNGIGVAGSEFEKWLVSFGASHKRGQGLRGFRGVGRLAGLGYCQEVTFRSCAHGELTSHELSWDCRKLRTVLRGSVDQEKTLVDLVRETASVRSIPVTDKANHFFEVELAGVVRHRNDQLLDPTSVVFYLAQVAPVPFSEEFAFAKDVLQALGTEVVLGQLNIHITGIDGPIRRPHRDQISIRQKETDSFRTIEPISIPGPDGGTAAVGWIAHHAYAGALPAASGVRGLRLRCGDIQIGDDRLLEEIFLEPRFNSWAVGEIHVVDRRITPNGRRDHFEQNNHFQHVLTHLIPIGRDISKRCRTSSVQRNRSRDLFLTIERLEESLAIVRQGSLGKADRARLVREVKAAIPELEKRIGTTIMEDRDRPLAGAKVTNLKRQLSRIENQTSGKSPLAKLPDTERRAFEKVLSLIYECAPNRSAAKVLVDRLLARIPQAVKKSGASSD